jgi:hypothetical protein
MEAVSGNSFEQDDTTEVRSLFLTLQLRFDQMARAERYLSVANAHIRLSKTSTFKWRGEALSTVRYNLAIEDDSEFSYDGQNIAWMSVNKVLGNDQLTLPVCEYDYVVEIELEDGSKTYLGCTKESVDRLSDCASPEPVSIGIEEEKPLADIFGTSTLEPVPEVIPYHPSRVRPETL